VINQPTGSCIYFSADFDASQNTFNSAIRPHFEAISAAFAAAGNPYRIGVYASGAVCHSLLDAGLVQLTWLSQSSGFRGTPEFKASRRWNILQALPEISERETIPPSGDHATTLFPQFALREGYQPRGSAVAA